MADLTIDQVKDYLGKLTVLELADLVKSLEEAWGVSAAAPVAMVAAAAGDGGAAAEAEQTEFDVVLISSGDKKIAVSRRPRSSSTACRRRSRRVCPRRTPPTSRGRSRKPAAPWRSSSATLRVTPGPHSPRGG